MLCRFVGDFTAADEIMHYPVEVTEHRDGGFTNFPHLAKYLQQVEERPAYKRTIEKIGKNEPIDV